MTKQFKLFFGEPYDGPTGGWYGSCIIPENQQARLFALTLFLIAGEIEDTEVSK